MGVIIAKVFDRQKEPPTPEFIAPTVAQQQMIKETWEIPKQSLKDSGEVILFRYLDKFPQRQDKFDAFRNVPLLSLKVIFIQSLLFPINSHSFLIKGNSWLSNSCASNYDSIPGSH